MGIYVVAGFISRQTVKIQTGMFAKKEKMALLNQR